MNHSDNRAETPTLFAARGFVRRGWRVVPIPRANGKAPYIADWPKLRIEESDLSRFFGDHENIGIILGEPSAGLVDIDLDVPEAVAAAEKLLPPTGMVHGRRSKSRSHWWYFADPLPATTKFQAPDGTMLVELRSTGCQTLVPPSTHPSGEPYLWDAPGDPARVGGEDLRRRLGWVASVAMIARVWPKTPSSRHEHGLALAGFLLQSPVRDSGKPLSTQAVSNLVELVVRIARDEEIEDRIRAVNDTAKRIEAGKLVTGARKLVELVGLATVDKLRKWLDLEAETPLVASVAASLRPNLATGWPEPLGNDAFYGLSGDVVKTIEPHTESDPAAILVQLLVAFGSIIGRSAHYSVEGDAHHTNLFAVIVGATAKARKGTSWGQVKKLMGAAERSSVWCGRCIQAGLSSGEGLIWAVRNPGTTESDPGALDKRLLVVETEFARPLVAMDRDGNVLSQLLRQAWDAGDLQILTKNNPARASGAHISVIGHITCDDLRRHLSSTEQANGFANRFLWICARRSKVLPEGGSLTDAALQSLAERLRGAMEFADSVTQMRRDVGARALWAELYSVLSDGRPGLLGAVVSRAEAQVLRLSMIYALLDLSAVIHVEHLRAAMAIWRYCDASARHIFGEALGDPVAEIILAALRSRGPDGLTRTEIRDLFGRHGREDKIAAALASLEALSLANKKQEPTEGRPAERWFAISQAAT